MKELAKIKNPLQQEYNILLRFINENKKNSKDEGINKDLQAIKNIYTKHKKIQNKLIPLMKELQNNKHVVSF